MLRHILLTIYRHFRRFRSTFLINLIGLSAGLTCTWLIYLWVNDEWQTDRFHQKDGRLFQVMQHQSHSEGTVTTQETPSLLAERLKSVFPEVEYAIVSTPPNWFEKTALSANDQLMKARGIFVGKEFFNVFSYRLIQGDVNQVLAEKRAIAISERTAMRLFNTTQNVIGKTVNWQINQFKQQGIVAGIFEDTPHQSSVQFDFLLPFQAFHDLVPQTAQWSDDGPFHTYLTLREDQEVDQLNLKLAGLIKSNLPNSERRLFLKPYADNYLYGTYENGIQTGGRIEYVRLFSLIALFIVLIACVNFTNLSTAKAVRRMKEVGIRKVLGAERRTLILQYLGEAVLMSVIALFLAVLCTYFLLPQFNAITGKQLSLSWNPHNLLVLLAISLMTGLLAGAYPALYLSGFRPAVILKGNLAFGKIRVSAGERWVRKGLVIFQFSLAIVFIVSVVVVYQQLEYVQTKHLGYDKDHVVYFESEGKVPESMDTFLNELKKLSGVVNASSMVGQVVGGPGVGIPIKGKAGERIIQFRPIQANYGLIETLGIEMSAGRPFSRQFPADNAQIIFNKAAVDALGLQNPVGKVIHFGGREVEVLGITKNFHFQSLHDIVKPLFFQLDALTGTVLVKIEAGKEKETLSRLRTFYQAYNPGFTFDYQFLDADHQAQYVAEQRVSLLSRYFAGLAVLISCLGLFGLVAFTTERRRKEIGVRKVLGASEWRIASLLSAEFAWLVLISILIAVPISYFMTAHWLESFAYRIELSPWYFIGAGMLALCTALLTVGTQAWKAAKTNPAFCLRED